MRSLQGLDILVTRPTDAAEPLCARLQSIGARCHQTAVMQITPLRSQAQEQAIKSLLLDFDRYQFAIFISQNAVRYGLDWIDRFWPQPPHGQRYLAIGAATARALNGSFLGPVESAANAMNSEALLALPSLQNINGQRVIIFRGLGGRETLAQTLLERGAEVDYCELYDRQVPENLKQQLMSVGFNQTTQKCLLTVHSGESLSNLSAAISNSLLEAWRNIPLLVPGERVAGMARELGFDRIVVAENASDSCVVDTIQHWYSEITPQ